MAYATKNQLAKLFFRLANSYSAGIDLRSALQRETGIGPPVYRRKLRIVADDIGEGGSLSGAFKKCGDYFPKLVLAVTRAGEKGGRMDEAFRRLANHYDNLVKFRNRFLAAIAWPLFELGAAIVIIGLLMLVMGFLLEGKEPGAPDWFGLGFGTTGNFILYCLFISTIGGGIGFLVVGTMRGTFGTLPMRLARRVPLIGPTIEALSLSRFAWTMSIAENAGMEAGETMLLALQSTQNYFYERLIPEVTDGVRSGNQFHRVLEKTNAFPEDLLILIENGETAGSLAETMERGSEQLQEKAEANLKIIATVGFAVMLGIVGLIMAVTIIMLYSKLILSPMNDVMNWK